MSERISLQDVRLDGGTQPRVGIDVDTVATYADLLLDGVKLPPVVVFYDGASYWLADGFHRVHAFGKLATTLIDADVRQGTKRDAVLYSVGANATHGKPRTNLDKRRSVQTLLSDEEWSQKSDRWIAEKACVNQSTVTRLRAETTGDAKHHVPPLPKVAKDGKSYTFPDRKKKSDPPAPAPVPPPSSKRQLTIEDVPEPAPKPAPVVVVAPIAASTVVRVVAESQAERAEIKAFGDLLARIARLSSEDQASLVCEVVEHLDEAHLHRVREVLDERTTPTRGPGREES